MKTLCILQLLKLIMARVVFFPNPLHQPFLRNYFSDFLGLGHFQSSHQSAQKLWPCFGIKMVSVGPLLSWRKNSISSPTTCWAQQSSGRRDTFLHQNTVTIFVHRWLDQKWPNPRTSEKNFSKKVGGSEFANKTTLSMITLEDTVRVSSVVESLLVVDLTTTGKKLWETIQLKSSISCWWIF